MVSSCGGACGCAPCFEVQGSLGAPGACFCCAPLFAVRFAVSFDLQLEATSATPPNAAHASATRAPVQKRLSLPACFFMSISALQNFRPVEKFIRQIGRAHV